MVSSGDGKPRSWALKAGLGLAALGLIGFLYAVSMALSKPDTGGYARFAKGGIEKLIVLEETPPQSTKPFQTADGTDVTLQSFRGKVVVMNLWGTWCAPCVEEMPTLGALQTKYADQPLVVVPIDLEPARMREKAIADLKRLSGGALTFYSDATLAIAFDSGANQGMPITVIYAKDGREIARLVGAANWNSPEAHAFFDAALAE